MLEKILAGEMRRLPARFADAEIDRRLPEIDRHELPVQIGNMQQRDIADRIEFEEFVFGEALLRHRAREAATAGGKRRRRLRRSEGFRGG